MFTTDYSEIDARDFDEATEEDAAEVEALLIAEGKAQAERRAWEAAQESTSGGNDFAGMEDW